MACKEMVEIKSLGITTPIAVSKTGHHVSVVETNDDNEVTDGLRATESAVVGGLRQRSLPSAREYVGIVTPGPNQEFTLFLKEFLKLVGKIKNGNATDNDRCTLPLGVRLCNERIIHISSSTKYREGIEFDMSERTLGKGNSSYPIRVVKDNMNAKEHALKSYHLDKGVVIKHGLEEFEEDEIRCWLDLNDSGNVPQLYMFQVINSKVLLHMEILENVITLKYLILTCRQKIITSQPSLLKPFSLHIFRLLLCIMNEFHKTGWTHNDLHGENVVIRIRSDTPPKLYILDFGKAKQSADIQQDMEDVAGLLQGMLMGSGKQTARDKQARILMTTKDREEIRELITKCSFLVQESDLPNYISLVESSLKKAKGNFNYEDREMFREITAIISSEPGTFITDVSIEMPFPSLPSPPKSPITSPLPPQTPLRLEDLTSNHPERNITLDTQVESGKYSEVHSCNLEDIAMTGINTEANTDNDQGDRSGILSNTLSKLKMLLVHTSDARKAKLRSDSMDMNFSNKRK